MYNLRYGSLLFVAILTLTGVLLPSLFIIEEAEAQGVPGFTWDFDKVFVDIDVSPEGNRADTITVTYTNLGSVPIGIFVSIPTDQREALAEQGINVGYVARFTIGPMGNYETYVGISALPYINSTQTQFQFWAEISHVGYSAIPYEDQNPKHAFLTARIDPYTMLELSSPDPFEEYWPGQVFDLHVAVRQTGNFKDKLLIKILNRAKLEKDNVMVQLSSNEVSVEPGKIELVTISISTPHVMWTDDIHMFEIEVKAASDEDIYRVVTLVIRTRGVYLWHEFYLVVYFAIVGVAMHTTYKKRIKKSALHSGLPGQYVPRREGRLRVSPAKKLAKKYHKKVIDKPAAEAKPKLPAKPSKVLDAPSLEPRKEIKEVPTLITKTGETAKPRETVKKGFLEKKIAKIGGGDETVKPRDTVKKGFLEKKIAKIGGGDETVKPRETVKKGILEKKNAKIGGDELIKPTEPSIRKELKEDEGKKEAEKPFDEEKDKVRDAFMREIRESLSGKEGKEDRPDAKKPDETAASATRKPVEETRKPGAKEELGMPGKEKGRKSRVKKAATQKEKGKETGRGKKIKPTKPRRESKTIQPRELVSKPKKASRWSSTVSPKSPKPPKPVLKKDAAKKDTTAKKGKGKGRTGDKVDKKKGGRFGKSGRFGKRADKKKEAKPEKPSGKVEEKKKEPGTAKPGPKKADVIGLSATRSEASKDVDLKTLAKMQDELSQSKKKGSASDKLKDLMGEKK